MSAARWRLLSIVLMVGIAWFFCFVSFVAAFGRFPVGAGEVLNWMFGL